MQTFQLLYIFCIMLDPLRFQIDLGCDADDLAMHFNPHFHDDSYGSILICSSKTDGCWDQRFISDKGKRSVEDLGSFEFFECVVGILVENLPPLPGTDLRSLRSERM
uniref:Galectin n=1 Tax=Sparus aurata TaxID=8175 RepID=A0A671V0Z1_SPAAU